MTKNRTYSLFGFWSYNDVYVTVSMYCHTLTIIRLSLLSQSFIPLFSERKLQNDKKETRFYLSLEKKRVILFTSPSFSFSLSQSSFLSLYLFISPFFLSFFFFLSFLFSLFLSCAHKFKACMCWVQNCVRVLLTFDH